MGIATRRLVCDGLTPVAAYAALRAADRDRASFLFESALGGERWGRRTLVGYRPRRELTLTPAGWTIRDERGERFERAPPGDPLEPLTRLVGSAPKEDPVTDLARASYGYVAWDVIHGTYRVRGFDAHSGPLARFFSGATLVVYDNLEQTVTVAGPTEEDVERALSDLSLAPRLSTFAVPDRRRRPERVDLSMDDAAYEGIVRRAKEYIAAGDAFQIVLARTFSLPAHGTEPFDAYRALRVLNPSPYMYFLDLPPACGSDAAEGRSYVLGASPETLVRLDGGVMTVRPIAGTRPRGASPAEDQALERELRADPKELAEHVMLIDLGRNDVGRVAEYGTVEVVRQMEVERYSHVMHLVSEVRGKLWPGTTSLAAFRSAFPAGTLSGAPKLRAMQIIRELEGAPRGLYGGAVGWIAPSGDLDFAIAIRTAVCKGGRYQVTAGAGIVDASVPEAEAAETWAKAGAVLCACSSSSR